MAKNAALIAVGLIILGAWAWEFYLAVQILNYIK
jgi:hypothetical protein